LAYLPPRGAGSSDARSFQAQAPRQTAARSRAQALAEQWRAADGAVRLLSMRRELQQTAPLLRLGGISLALVADSAGVPIPTPALVDSAGRVAWRQLGLGETKVKVVLITQFATGAGIHERPAGDADYITYLTPDSTDRTTCLAFVPMGPYWTRMFFGAGPGRLPSSSPISPAQYFGAFVETLKAGLGPCAYYAAYGTPSRS